MQAYFSKTNNTDEQHRAVCRAIFKKHVFDTEFVEYTGGKYDNSLTEDSEVVYVTSPQIVSIEDHELTMRLGRGTYGEIMEFDDDSIIGVVYNKEKGMVYFHEFLFQEIYNTNDWNDYGDAVFKMEPFAAYVVNEDTVPYQNAKSSMKSKRRVRKML